MVVGVPEVQLVLVMVGMLILAIIGVAVFFVVLYFVVRNAVLAALRKRDEERYPAQIG